MAQQTETNSDKSEVITEKDNLSLQCSECTFTSKDSTIMKGHTAAKHGAFKCSSKQSKLENQVKSIHGAHTHREYSCNKCPDTFKSENALQVHKKQYHYNKWFTCDECGSQCNKLNELEQHKAMFHNQFTQNKKMCRYFRRGFCRYRYNCKFVHENLQQAKCNYCDEVFMSHYKLKQHIMSYHSSNTTQVTGRNVGT